MIRNFLKAFFREGFFLLIGPKKKSPNVSGDNPIVYVENQRQNNEQML